MGILKTIAAAVMLPFILVGLLTLAAIGVIVFYVLWLVGVPVTVTINGAKYKYRWLKRLYRV